MHISPHFEELFIFSESVVGLESLTDIELPALN